MNKDVFRKVSIDRLSSPEQLDTLTKVTSPKGWLALISIGLLIIIGITWGFTGRLSVNVNGQGILIKPGGLSNVSSLSEGRITDLRVAMNDTVKRGDVIARIHQPEILSKMNQVKQQLATLAETVGIKDEGQAQRIANQAAINKILDQLTTEYENASKVVSSYNGRVLEVKVKRGDYVQVGSPVITMEVQSNKMKNLEAVMYVTANEGKKIIPGMDVQINPASIKREDYGLMLGRVVSVSEYPATMQSMMITIGNEVYVRELAASKAALLEVHVELIDDSQTVSGYKWSTRQGPPAKIDSGTPMTGAITLKQQRPISYVIPQFK